MVAKPRFVLVNDSGNRLSTYYTDLDDAIAAAETENSHVSTPTYVVQPVFTGDWPDVP